MHRWVVWTLVTRRLVWGLGMSWSGKQASTGQATKKKVVIIGGGLQGTSTAYWLAQKSEAVEVTIVERTGIGAAASGKGGGFLARNWGRGPTRALHQRSFDMIGALASEFPLKSYRRLRTLEVTGELGLREWPPQDKATTSATPPSSMHPRWLDATDAKARLMDQDCAQVNPAELCAAFFERSGATLKKTAARGFELDADGRRVVGVATDDGVLDCDSVVVAAGAWSVLIEDWVPGFKLPMEGIYSTSVVFKDDAGDVNRDPAALFCAEDSNGCHLEVYPRNDGTVYLCGIGGSDHVSGARLREGGDLQDADKMAANPDRVQAARRSFGALAPAFVDATPLDTNACMRPCAADALPVIGRLEQPNMPDNIFLNTAGNCWGILWSAITGHIVSDLLLDRVPDVEINAFRPARFMPRANNRGRAQASQAVGEQW